MNSYLSFQSLRSLRSLISLHSLILLAAALTLAACSQDGDPAATAGAPLQISVTAQGFSPSPSERGQGGEVETRASDVNYKTTFTNGDQIGITVVNGSSILHNNVPCTYNSSSGAWEPDETILNRAGATYFAYYPYNSGNDGKLPAAIISDFTPKADQSGYAGYTASDLMTADGSISGTTLTVALAHKLALVEVTLPSGGTGLTVTTGGGLVTAYNISGDTYRCIVETGTVTLNGSYEQSGIPIAWRKENVVLDEGKYTPVAIEVSSEDCTITFDDNGGTGGPGTLVKKKGTALGPLAVPTNGTAIFGGWYTTKDTGWNKCLTIDLSIARSTRTFYARWYTPDANDAADLGSATPVIEGIGYVTGGDDWNAIKNIPFSSGKNYIVNVETTVNIGGANNTFGSASGMKVVIRGNGGLTLNSTGKILDITANQSVILRGPTLTGITQNSGSAVNIAGSNSTFTLESGIITGNNRYNYSGLTQGGGVYVGNGGVFTMSGGTISNNTVTTGSSGDKYGGGVCVVSGGIFTMSGGVITGNSSYYGGGVRVGGGVFTMSGGSSITSNTATGGGGVFVNNSGTFTIEGANGAHTSMVSNNTASSGNNVMIATGTINGSTGATSGW